MKARVPSGRYSPAGPHTSTGSRRPALARLHSSVGMSPTWSACRWVRNTFVVAVTGRRSPLKLASAPDPRSKKNRSRSALPTSISTDADAWLFFTNGSPLPRIVTRISPADRLGPRLQHARRIPTRSPDDRRRRQRCALPSYASSVSSLISAVMCHAYISIALEQQGRESQPMSAVEVRRFWTQRSGGLSGVRCGGWGGSPASFGAVGAAPMSV